MCWNKASQAQCSLDRDYQNAEKALKTLSAVTQADMTQNPIYHALYQRIEGVLRFIEQLFLAQNAHLRIKKVLQAWKNHC